MLRTLDCVERNVFDDPLNPVVVPDGQSTDVFPDTSNRNDVGEIAYLELFNAGANNAYYAYGRDADSVNNYNAFIAPGAMLEVKTRERVSIYAVGGTIISRTRLMRRTAVSSNQ